MNHSFESMTRSNGAMADARHAGALTPAAVLGWWVKRAVWVRARNGFRTLAREFVDAAYFKIQMAIGAGFGRGPL
jgi:hypothetical protein